MEDVREIDDWELDCEYVPDGQWDMMKVPKFSENNFLTLLKAHNELVQSHNELLELVRSKFNVD
jgi:hypothetical protein